MRDQIILHLTGLALLIGVILTGCDHEALDTCTDTIGCVHIAPGDPIKLAVLQSISHRVPTEDQDRTFELTLAERDNQLLGHPITLQTEDSRCTPGGGATAALKVAADPQIIAVLGTTCSASALTASKIISEAGMVMISGINNAPSLTSISGEPGSNWHPGYFRTAFNGALLGQVAAIFAFQERGVRKAATINAGDASTRESTDAFAHEFTKLGGEIVLDAVVNRGDTNMRPLLTAVARSQAELIYMPLLLQELAPFITQAETDKNVEHVSFVGAPYTAEDFFIDAVGSAGLGMYSVIPAPLSGPDYDRFITDFVARYEKSPIFPLTAHNYDAINLLLTAIEKTAVQEADGTLHIGRQALRDTLYAIRDFQGVTGRLSCDAFGDFGAIRFNVIHLDDAAGMDGIRRNVVYTYEQ